MALFADGLAVLVLAVPLRRGRARVGAAGERDSDLPAERPPPRRDPNSSSCSLSYFGESRAGIEASGEPSKSNGSGSNLKRLFMASFLISPGGERHRFSKDGTAATQRVDCLGDVGRCVQCVDHESNEKVWAVARPVQDRPDTPT
jgi:hypothetical protein